MNAFPSTGGVTGPYSPANILEGITNPDCNRKRIPFGSYAIAYIGTSNNMEPRAVPSIALYESNEFDGQYFMSIETGKRIHCRKWEKLPITKEIINTINSMAQKENQPSLLNRVPLFEWAPGLEIDNYDYSDEITVPIIDDALDDVDMNHLLIPDVNNGPKVVSDDERSISGIDDDSMKNKECEDNSIEDKERSDDESDDSIAPLLQPIDNDEEPMVSDDTPAIINDDGTISTNILETTETVTNNDDDVRDNNELSSDNTDDDTINSSDHSFHTNNVVDEDMLKYQAENEPDVESDELPQPPEINTNFDGIYDSEEYVTPTRPRRVNAGVIERLKMSFGGKKYASTQQQSKTQLFMSRSNQQSENDRKAMIRKTIHVLLTQVSAVKGFKMFGERAVAAMVKELKQLNDGAMPGKPVVVPQDPDVLTEDEKESALEAVNLIKEKRDGRIKGRTCANGSKQRKYVKEGEISSSPTASLESIIATLVIDSYEKGT